MPLRNVYSTLFTTGLHLQNSLLKLRHIEGLFEALEKSKDKETVSTFIPSDKQVLGWLHGFQEIQTELNHCLTCLDGGVEEMETIARPTATSSSRSSSSSESVDCQINEKFSHHWQQVDENEEIAKMDQVFEAFISCDFNVDSLCFEDDFVTKTTELDSQSKKVPGESKSFMQVREVKHLTRQENVEEKKETDNGINLPSPPTSLISTNVLGTDLKCFEFLYYNIGKLSLGLSQETDSEGESIRSDTNTIKSPSEWETSGRDHRKTNGQTQSVCSISSQTVSDSSDSNHSDVEVEKSHKMYNRTIMSVSCCQVNHERPGENVMNIHYSAPETIVTQS